jgi:hypothetical protein
MAIVNVNIDLNNVTIGDVRRMLAKIFAKIVGGQKVKSFTLHLRMEEYTPTNPGKFSEGD